MNEEDKELLLENLLEVLSLLYVLETALDNDMQETKDTTPFAFLVKLIRYKIADASDILQL